MEKSDFFISTDKKRLNIPLIHDFLCNHSYWAKGRSLERVKRSIENSICFGAYLNNEQIGFARVLTDYTVFAWIMDVFILEQFRWQGYGKKLMKTIMEYPDLQDIRRWGLGTQDAHGLYSRFGFNSISNPENFMQKINDNSL